MVKKKKKNNSVSRRVIFKVSIMVLSVYLIYSMISLQAELVENRKVLSDLQAQNSSINVSNEELENLLNNGSEEELIERAARDKLGFVYKNEEVYEDIKGN